MDSVVLTFSKLFPMKGIVVVKAVFLAVYIYFFLIICTKLMRKWQVLFFFQPPVDIRDRCLSLSTIIQYVDSVCL